MRTKKSYLTDYFTLGKGSSCIDVIKPVSKPEKGQNVQEVTPCPLKLCILYAYSQEAYLMCLIDPYKLSSQHVST